MKLCDETITVFNAKLNTETDLDEYIGTVIEGVSWYCETASVVDSTGLKAADKYTIRIPTDTIMCNARYVSPTEYRNSMNPHSVFTLKNGDIIVRGAVLETGLKPAQLNTNYESFTILSVTDNRRARNAPHWKVVGA